MKFSIKDFITFAEEILNGKLPFFAVMEGGNCGLQNHNNIPCFYSHCKPNQWLRMKYCGVLPLSNATSRTLGNSLVGLLHFTCLHNRRSRGSTI